MPFTTACKLPKTELLVQAAVFLKSTVCVVFQFSAAFQGKNGVIKIYFICILFGKIKQGFTPGKRNTYFNSMIVTPSPP